jgi:hypothetical protein
MADDNSRPAHGPSPDQRSTEVPAWWPSLAREDLPDGGAATVGTPSEGGDPGGERSLRGRSWRLVAAAVRILRRGGR